MQSLMQTTYDDNTDEGQFRDIDQTLDLSQKDLNGTSGGTIEQP